MDIQRYRQVCHWGWKHAGQIAADEVGGFFMRVKIFFDILYCFRHYKMWSNQYKKESFHKKSVKEREAIGAKYYEEGKIRDAWQKDFREGREFLLKYTQRKYELAKYREERNRAYAKRFNAGEGLFVEHDVEITRQHYLPGTIKIGKKVLLAKHVTIDYSGEVIIGDNVALSEYVNVLSHDHVYDDISEYINSTKIKAVSCRVEFEDACWLGANVVVLPSCHKVGRGAIVGAGSVLRTNIPPYAIVTGNPARVVGFRFSVDEILKAEEQMYPIESRYSRQLLEKNYNKYYDQKIADIVKYLKL